MVSGPNRKVTKLKRDKLTEQEQERLAVREERRKRGFIRRFTALSIVAGTVTIVSSVALFSQHGMIQSKEEEKIGYEEQLADLEAEEKALKQEIANYNDPDYIEEVARKDLYLTKPGETIFKLPTQED